MTAQLDVAKYKGQHPKRIKACWTRSDGCYVTTNDGDIYKITQSGKHYPKLGDDISQYKHEAAPADALSSQSKITKQGSLPGETRKHLKQSFDGASGFKHLRQQFFAVLHKAGFKLSPQTVHTTQVYWKGDLSVVITYNSKDGGANWLYTDKDIVLAGGDSVRTLTQTLQHHPEHAKVIEMTTTDTANLGKEFHHFGTVTHHGTGKLKIVSHHYEKGGKSIEGKKKRESEVSPGDTLHFEKGSSASHPIKVTHKTASGHTHVHHVKHSTAHVLHNLTKGKTLEGGAYAYRGHEKRDAASTDTAFAHQELVAHAYNTDRLHSRRKAYEVSMSRKHKAGKYDHELAKKAWTHFADDVAKDYHKEAGNPSTKWHDMFSVSERRKAGETLANNHLAELEAGNYTEASLVDEDTDTADMVRGAVGFGEHHVHHGKHPIHVKSVHHVHHSEYRKHHASVRKMDKTHFPRHTESTIHPGEQVHMMPMGAKHHIVTHHTKGGHVHKHILSNKRAHEIRNHMKKAVK